MTPSIRRKLEALAERHEEIGRLLIEPSVSADPQRFRALSREYAHLEDVVGALHEYDSAEAALASAEAMRADPELHELADEEARTQRERLQTLGETLGVLL